MSAASQPSQPAKRSKSTQPSRRTILRAAGVCLALPALESLSATRLAAAEPAGGAKPTARLLFIYNPHGPANEHWHPKDTGRNYTLSRTLSAMKDWRQAMTVLSGPNHALSHGGHAMVARILSGWSENDHQKGPVSRQSVDQIAAETMVNTTRFPSLQMSVDGGVGPTDHSRTMAFSRSGRGLPSIQDPRQLFQQLFVPEDAKSKAHAAHRFTRRTSLLDDVMDQLGDLNKDLGKADQRRLGHFQESVREVEQQLQRDYDWSQVAKPSVTSDGLHLKPANRIEWINTINDITLLAFQTDSTRVASILYGVERDHYPWRERPNSNSNHHHALQHHNGKEDRIEQMHILDSLKLKLLSRFCKRLQETQTPSGSLLDHTMIWYGHGMNNGTNDYGRGMGGHSTRSLSHLVLGGAHFGLKHGRHLKYDHGTMPLANLWITMLNRFGVDIEQFVDSTGGLDELLRA